jgi:hypothetical protein
MTFKKNLQEVTKNYLGGNGLMRTITYNHYLIIIDDQGHIAKKYSNHKFLNDFLPKEENFIFEYNKNYLLIIDGELYESTSTKTANNISTNKIDKLNNEEITDLVSRSELEELYNNKGDEIRYCFNTDGKEITSDIPTEKEIIELVKSRLKKDVVFIKEDPDCRLDQWVFDYMDLSIKNLKIDQIPPKTKFISDNLIIIKLKNGIIRPIKISCKFMDKNNYEVNYTKYDSPNLAKISTKEDVKVRSLRGKHAI